MNESAERLHDALGHFRNRGVRIQMITEALAAERRATVERIRERLSASADAHMRNADEEGAAGWVGTKRWVLSILDEEASR
jgi:hypothetical protein